MLPLHTVRIRPEIFQSKSGQNHEAEDACVSPETRRPLWVTLGHTLDRVDHWIIHRWLAHLLA